MSLTTWMFLAFAAISTSEGSIRLDVGNNTTPSFAVDYENNQFLLDGEPFRYVSGSFHYFRAPRVYWRDRLRKMRAAGLNAVSTYVEWSLHEPIQGQWKWEDEADLEYFLNLAREEDLFVLLRPGPYICAERDLGGLPSWLLSRVPNIRLRTSDTRYMSYVTTYINELMKKVNPFLRGNGGPVIMVQVENEYGSYHACDLNYTSQVRDLLSNHVGDKAVLYTTDGAGHSYLRCGVIPGVFITVDFGVGSNVKQAFATLRPYQSKGPLVNSEFYSGWLTHWEESYKRVNASAVAKKLDEMLAAGASVNLYVFYGGTNFAFTSGANTSPNYQPQLTSYDYDALLTEAGDFTDKYYATKNVIAKYLPIPNITLPEPPPKGDYGTVQMRAIAKLFDPWSRSLGIQKLMLNEPPTFESFDTFLALVLYEADLPANPHSDPSILRAGFIHDRALVYEDDHFVGTLSRSHKINSLPLSSPYARKLKILVENQGHINYGVEIHDFKGVGNVTLNGVSLPKWNATGFVLSDSNHLRNLTTNQTIDESMDYGPIFFSGSFSISDEPLDTFLDTTGWGKGIAYINGNNLGRYWPTAGPQMTLYVPATFLKRGKNIIILLELEQVRETKNIEFRTTPK